MDDVRTLEIAIEGEMCKAMRGFCNGETDLQAALELTTFQRQDLTKPDSLKVSLTEMHSERYVPPRCRKWRTRMVYTTLAEYTLGELRHFAKDDQDYHQ